MFKRVTLVFLSFNLLIPNLAIAKDSSQDSHSFVEYFVFWAVVGAGTAVTIMYAPIVIPMAIANAKAAAVIVGTKAAVAGAAVKTGIAVVAPVAKTLGPIVFMTDCAVKIANQAPEIQLHMVTAAESREFSQAKEKFDQCMNKYAYPNPFIVPENCKKEALLVALLEQANI